MDIQAMNSTPVGVVGLGLMGSSIVVALLAAGHRVVALAPIAGEKEKASGHLADLLRHADGTGMLPQGIDACIGRLQLVEDYRLLADCHVVMDGNAYFATPEPDLITLLTAVDDFREKMEMANRKGSPLDFSLKNDSRA